MPFILCHKCGGVLQSDGKSELYGCGCISGWVRGFEKSLTLIEAAAAQLESAERRLKLYRDQGREETGDHVTYMVERVAKSKAYVEALKPRCGYCGSTAAPVDDGQADWEHCPDCMGI